MAIGPGTILNNRYRVVQLLDSGGMGAVWLGRDLKFDRPVAIKVLLQNDPDPQVFERFRREAQILARLSHPAITVVLDDGRHGNQFFIVMELMEGDNLATILRSSPHGLPVARAVHFAEQAAEALAFAHQKGVVHRDVKPANMFVLHSDRLKIFDFGIAKKANTEWTLTQPGAGMGTPAYMSPEQFDRADEADKLSDLYSLGCAVYEMLTGLPPFGGDGEWTTLAGQHKHAVPRPPRGAEPIPPALSDLVLRLLAKDPRERPETASEVARKLKGISAGVSGDNRRPGRKTRFASPPDDRSGPVPRERITEVELRKMGPKRAADVLEDFTPRRLAAGGLNDLTPGEAAAIMRLISHNAAAEYLGVMNPAHAARVLEAMDREDGTAILASFSSEGADDAGRLLGAMASKSAARLTVSVSEEFLAGLLVRVERTHAVKILDAMEISRRRSVVGHMTSADSRMLRALAETHLEEAESHIREEQDLEREDEARQQVQRDLLPWTWAVRNSAWLLFATTVAFDVGATAWNWESWSWLFLFIPVGLISVAGGLWAAAVRFISVAMAAWGTALFLAASLASVLIVVHAIPRPAGVPVVVIAAVSGTAVAGVVMLDEDVHLSSVRRARQRGARARQGSDGSSRGTRLASS
jgi:hypothetical protein